MEEVMRKFNVLLMSQQFDFLQYFISGGGPKNPEPEVIALYEDFKQLSLEQQIDVEKRVRCWAFSLTREEMFKGAREEENARKKK